MLSLRFWCQVDGKIVGVDDVFISQLESIRYRVSNDGRIVGATMQMTSGRRVEINGEVSEDDLGSILLGVKDDEVARTFLGKTKAPEAPKPGDPLCSRLGFWIFVALLLLPWIVISLSPRR